MTREARFESPKILAAMNSMNIPISEPSAVLHQPPVQATTSPYLSEDDVLRYDKDKYKGVIVDCSALPSKLEDFIFQLNYSLQHWKVIGRRGVWLKIPIEKSHFISPAVDMGFCFHHAEKEYLMLNYWLSPEENRMPPNASHQVGVGSVVILGQGSNKKLLLVQEKSGPLRGSGIWKLPTGLVEQGEDISAAAEREVLEETGIEASFAGLLCFRHAHNALFGKSDLFFLCLLKPKSTTIEKQVAEIADCKWLDPEVYFQQDFFRKSGVYCKMNDMIRQAVETGSFPAEEDLAHSAAALPMNDAGETSINAGDESSNGGEANSNQQQQQADVKVTSLVSEKLPIGFRPGFNSLYYIRTET